MRGDHEATAASSEAARAIAVEYEMPLWQGWASVFAGWAASVGGAVDEGIATIREGLRLARATDAITFLPHCLSLSAEADARVGRLDSALATIEEALALCERNDERYVEPELHRQRGAYLLALGGPDAAAGEAALQRALALARHQGARMLELRTATSLGTRWRDQGRTTEARALLAPLYDSLTEGLDTDDPRRAAELLSTLGGAKGR
ncbi:MAG: hypothetical protein R3C15_10690 [Thermoleophilia bacterium]